MNRKVIILFFIAVIGINSLEAQNRAFLESGPVSWSGMPGIGLNSIPGYKGVYMLSATKRGASSETALTPVDVYFTQTSVPVFSSWKTLTLSPNTIYETESGFVYIYKYLESWTFFIDFKIKENINLSFAENIVKQMIYFVKDGSNFINTSFPAVVEF